MESLNSLIHQAGADDPLARSMEAIVDSGLILFTRDSGGHFVQLSEVLAARLGMGDARGKRQPGETQIFNGEGKALSGAEYPAAIVQTTGRAQRNVLRRIERSGKHVWAMMSTMPLERTSAGFGALTIGTDVTEIVDARDTATRAASVRGALVEVGAELAGRSVTQPELVELLREPMAELAPAANVLLAVEDGSEFEMTLVHHGFGSAPRTGRGYLAPVLRDRWRGPEAHVNLGVQPTDIYCGSVVAELEDPFRSLVLTPCGEQDARGALVAMHPGEDAFDDWQIETLELAGRLVGAALGTVTSQFDRRSA